MRTDGQTDGQADRQTDGQTHLQSETETQFYKLRIGPTVQTNPIYFPIFIHNVWSYLLWPPVK